MIREQRLDPVVHHLEVRDELGAEDLSGRPALAASVEQALTILELLRPKTVVQAPRKWVTPLSLPRIEPPATAWSLAVDPKTDPDRLGTARPASPSTTNPPNGGSTGPVRAEPDASLNRSCRSSSPH